MIFRRSNSDAYGKFRDDRRELANAKRQIGSAMPTRIAFAIFVWLALIDRLFRAGRSPHLGLFWSAFAAGAFAILRMVYLVRKYTTWWTHAYQDAIAWLLAVPDNEESWIAKALFIATLCGFVFVIVLLLVGE
jgi:type IV secretory pathway TraG/TraD family ATPase VirD4